MILYFLCRVALHVQKRIIVTRFLFSFYTSDTTLPSLPLHLLRYMLLYWPCMRNIVLGTKLTDISSLLQKFHRFCNGWVMQSVYIEYSMFMHQFAEGAIFNICCILCSSQMGHTICWKNPTWYGGCSYAFCRIHVSCRTRRSIHSQRRTQDLGGGGGARLWAGPQIRTVRGYGGAL